MQVRRAAAAAAAAAAAMDAGHQVSSEGNALPPPGGAAREPAGLRCPRCDSTDTKFCYYNNYNLGQPRHFCKGCRRYWTRGGALRNVPVGGGSRKASPSASRRKHQRAAASTSLTSSSSAAVAALMASATPLSMPAPAYGDLPPFMSSPVSSMGDHVDRRMLLGHDRRLLLDPDRRMLAPAPDAARFSSSSAGLFLGGGGLSSPPVMPSSLPASSAHALLPPPQTPVAHASSAEGMIWGAMSMTMGWPDLSI